VIESIFSGLYGYERLMLICGFVLFVFALAAITLMIVQRRDFKMAMVLIVLAIVVILVEVNIARLIVTLSPLQIAMFLVAQLVGVSIGLAIIGFAFPLPPGAQAALAGVGA